MTSTSVTDTFPRQYARTQRFTLGEPRSFTVSADGHRVVFLRSRSGSDPVNCLWEYDVASRTERLIADPVALSSTERGGNLSAEELALRERLREAGAGITAYTTDENLTVFAFALLGNLYIGTFADAAVERIDTGGSPFDPRLDPTGSRLAFVLDGELSCLTLDRSLTSTPPRLLAGRSIFSESEEVSWGVADFIAAEEMGRHRGYWWSPTGRWIAIARVDESPVEQWTIADPAQPSIPARVVHYPAAGSANAIVGLALFDADSGERRDVTWDAAELPYLADVSWRSEDSLLVTVQSRDQRTLQVGTAAWDSPALRGEVAETSETWVDLVPGVPLALPDGRIAMVAERSGVNRLVVGDLPVTPDSLDVRHVLNHCDGDIVFGAIDVRRPQSWAVWAWNSATGSTRPLTESEGMHSASVSGSTMVVRRASLGLPRATVTITSTRDPRPDAPVVESFAELPLVEPNVRFLRAGARDIPCALILPRDIADGMRLPVLMDPYGGPHAQRVVDSYAAHCTSQWFADQGFAVLVVDGRGTPGLGSTWERAVHRDLATGVLEDQVDALQAVAAQYPVLDTSRVAIRGWSFGGYLAALAVLRRPDVFHAAVAGAPVTDWRLYDTHYTERYLGDPSVDAGPYARTSLVSQAADLSRPLLLIHGLADDNVVAAHTLQLSAALLAAGKPHEVLPLSGVTHMTPQAVVAENLLLHQLDFLRRSLGPS